MLYGIERFEGNTSVRPADNRALDLTKLHALFLLADIPILQIAMVPNGYLPEDYYARRRAHPWFEVSTYMGVITLGWRKRVLEISWKNIPVDDIITQDNVDKGHRFVHALSYGAAAMYLEELARFYKSTSIGEKTEY